MSQCGRRSAPEPAFRRLQVCGHFIFILGHPASSTIRGLQPAISASTSLAAAIVASMSASVWAAEKKSASYWLHGR